MPKDNFVAFKPFVESKPSQINAPTKIDVPDYPDCGGIEYANYCKRLISGNDYRLIPQDKVDINYIISATAGQNTFSLVRPNSDTKDFYCQRIVMSCQKASGVGGINVYFTICDDTKVRLVNRENTTSAYDYQFEFPVPIKFSKGNTIKVIFTVNRNANDKLYINFYGWEEEAPN